MAQKHSMQVTETESKGLKRAYDVLVPAAVINQKIETRLQSMGQRLKVPGFRPGNVPMKVLQQKFGKSVMAEVLEQTVNQSAKDAMEMKKLRPALPAKIEITNYEEGGELAFKMAVEVLPEVPSMDFSKITLERLVVDVPASEIDQGLERLRERNRNFIPKDKSAKAAEGDVVVIDFTGKKDGVAFEGGSAKKFRLGLGSGQFIPGFEDQLIGAKAGDEKTVKVTFPKEYHKEDLAGEPVEFDVTVHEVLEPQTPELNDEFAKEIGFDTVKELRDAVEKQIRKDYEGISRNQLKK